MRFQYSLMILIVCGGLYVSSVARADGSVALDIASGGAATEGSAGSYSSAEAYVDLTLRTRRELFEGRSYVEDCRNSLFVLLMQSCPGGADLGLSAAGYAEFLKGDVEALSYGEELTLGLAYIELHQFFHHQSEGHFHDWFWRSRDGLVEQGGGFTIPALWYVIDDDFEGRGVSLYVRGSKVFQEPLGEQEVGVEVTLGFYMAEIESDRWRRPLSIKALGVIWHRTPIQGSEEGVTQREETTQRRTLVAQKFDIRGLDLSGWELDDHWRLDIALGWSVLMPVHLQIEETTEALYEGAEDQIETRYDGVWANAFSGRLGVQYDFRSASWARVDVGTFDRLDPTGYGVDYGGFGGLSVHTQPLRWLTVAGEGQFAVTRRMLVSPYAEPHGIVIDAEGTLLTLGRAEASLEIAPFERVALRVVGWAERTDRVEPFRPSREVAARVAPQNGWGGEAVVQVSVF